MFDGLSMFPLGI